MIEGDPLPAMDPFWAVERRPGQRTALVRGNTEISYATLSRHVDARCVALAAAGVRPGVLCALAMEPEPDAVITYLAALRSEVPLLLTPPDLAAPLAERTLAALGVAHRLASDGSPTPTGNASPRCREDLALLLGTSGSTGSPKNVMLSAANLAANASAIAAYLPMDDRDTAITALPLSYSYGLSVLNSHLAVGASVCLCADPLVSRPFWQTMRERQVTNLAGVPFSYQMLRTLRLERMDLPALRCLTQAGGRLVEQEVRHFHQLCAGRGWAFFVMYGQTEATARMAYLPPEALPDAADCVGRPIPGGAFLLRDPETRECLGNDPHGLPAGRAGELCYRGPNVMLGYAASPADLESTDRLAELATGDLAEVTADGWIRIVGRRSRFVKLRGRRFQLDHLEESLGEEADGALRCTGRDDHLVVACTAASDATRLADRLHERYGLHPSLFRVLLLDAIPRLSSGKPDDRAILDAATR